MVDSTPLIPASAGKEKKLGHTIFCCCCGEFGSCVAVGVSVWVFYL
jgi:hypothetical protein